MEPWSEPPRAEAAAALVDAPCMELLAALDRGVGGVGGRGRAELEALAGIALNGWRAAAIARAVFAGEAGAAAGRRLITT